jgi:hypothetical protein
MAMQKATIVGFRRKTLTPELAMQNDFYLDGTNPSQTPGHLARAQPAKIGF